MDDLNHELLRATLGTRPFKFFSSIDSTNTAAHEWIGAGAAHGSVIIADEQVRGRGRLSRQWQTPPGKAIAMSVILRRLFAPSELERLTMVFSMAVAEALMQHTAQSIRLKWPNDILLNGKKVCGILIELIWQGDSLVAVVGGIGINVRVDFSGNPVLGEIATSLEPHTTQPIRRATLINDILQRIDHWLTQLPRTNIHNRYRNLLSTLGNQVRLKTTLGQIVGLAEDVDATGALLVRLDSGALMRVTVGDIVA